MTTATQPTAEPELSPIQQETLDQATIHVRTLMDELDQEGLSPEEIASWLLSMSFMVMAKHYVPGNVHDWMVEGVRCMIADTADEVFNNKLQ